jgi:hypothetical protein
VGAGVGAVGSGDGAGGATSILAGLILGLCMYPSPKNRSPSTKVVTIHKFLSNWASSIANDNTVMTKNIAATKYNA